MYFDEPVTATTVSASLDVRVVLSTNGLLVLLLGIFPGALMALCADSVCPHVGGLMSCPPAP
jgi:NADH-quinone oxidoreductase subunit N